MGIDTQSEWERWVQRFVELKKCMYALREGPHKVAHRATADYLSKDGYPACQDHADVQIRPGWRGYVRGA
jgi:hypothetical protein